MMIMSPISTAKEELFAKIKRLTASPYVGGNNFIGSSKISRTNRPLNTSTPVLDRSFDPIDPPMSSRIVTLSSCSGGGSSINDTLSDGSLDEATSSSTEDELVQLFSRFGEVRNAKVVLDSNSGVSGGYGFVTFETEEEARRLYDAMNNEEIGPITHKERLVDIAAGPEIAIASAEAMNATPQSTSCQNAPYQTRPHAPIPPDPSVAFPCYNWPNQLQQSQRQMLYDSPQVSQGMPTFIVPNVPYYPGTLRTAPIPRNFCPVPPTQAPNNTSGTIYIPIQNPYQNGQFQNQCQPQDRHWAAISVQAVGNTNAHPQSHRPIKRPVTNAPISSNALPTSHAGLGFPMPSPTFRPCIVPNYLSMQQLNQQQPHAFHGRTYLQQNPSNLYSGFYNPTNTLQVLNPPSF